MNKYLKNSFVILLGLVIISCSKVPITGRKQLKLLPNSMMMEMGQSNYTSFLKQNPAINPPTYASSEVTAVGVRISQAVEKYMKDNGLASKIAGYKWEFNVVDSKEANAWCMPGGKVVVYTGILPLTRDDAGLAVVLGHEIAHAIADHGNERMSQELAIQAAGIGLEVFMQQKPQQTRDIFMSSFGVGSQLGILAYSRQHELEADKLGLVFMAMAGYNPERAVSFWQDMSKAGGTKPPEIMSTHPSDERRIAQVQAFLPEAEKYFVFNPAGQGTGIKSSSTPSTQQKPAVAPTQQKPSAVPATKKLGVKAK
ncbi:MAG: M48 family metallopeptidase [Bacteroidota bacterium]